MTNNLSEFSQFSYVQKLKEMEHESDAPKVHFLASYFMFFVQHKSQKKKMFGINPFALCALFQKKRYLFLKTQRRAYVR